MVTLTVSGKLNEENVTVIWDDGVMYGDPALVKKMLDIAAEKLYVHAPEPNGLIPIELQTPESFVPLARLALDEVTSVEPDRKGKPDEVN